MRVHYILHAEFEELGVIADWLKQHNYPATGTHTYKGETLPAVSEFDLLIVMGGPQSVVHIDNHPYLHDEVALIKEAIQQNKAVLGICLGSQLIGHALGARASHSPHKEIGVHPVSATPAGWVDPLFKQFSQQFDVMHWHGDMAGLPEGSVLLASSAGCPHQAFRFGDKVYAFQFHMELTPSLVRKMIEHCPEDLEPAQYVQSADELMGQDYTLINQKMVLALDYLAGVVQSGQ